MFWSWWKHDLRPNILVFKVPGHLTQAPFSFVKKKDKSSALKLGCSALSGSSTSTGLPGSDGQVSRDCRVLLLFEVRQLAGSRPVLLPKWEEKFREPI